MTRTERRKRAAGPPGPCGVRPGRSVLLVVLVLALATPSAAEAEADYIAPEITAPATPEPVIQEPEAEADPAEYLVKTIYGEARGCSTTEQAAVVWCVLNRVDDESGLWPDDIVAVVTQPSQFHGYDPDHPVLPELLTLAKMFLPAGKSRTAAWAMWGGVLPREYTYFSGDGRTTISAQSGTEERPGTGGWKAHTGTLGHEGACSLRGEPGGCERVPGART